MKTINTKEYLNEAWQALSETKCQFVFGDSEELDPHYINEQPIESDLIYSIGNKIWFNIKERIEHEVMFQSY